MQVKVNQSFNRLDKFLFQYFESIPLSLIQRLIRQYKIKINNKKSKANSDLKKGDIIFIYYNFEIKNQKNFTIKISEDFRKTLRKKIIFENKEYSTNVPDVEVKKFIRDIEHTKCHGIFLSQTTGIANKKHFEINFHNNFVLVYLHNVNYDKDLIYSAVQIIDMITSKIDLTNIDTEKISKDVLSDIQKDFMLFLKQKKTFLRSTQLLRTTLVGNCVACTLLFWSECGTQSALVQWVVRSERDVAARLLKNKSVHDVVSCTVRTRCAARVVRFRRQVRNLLQASKTLKGG